MIAAAGLGIAFNAKPLVRAQADASVEGRLDAVLPLIDAESTATTPDATAITSTTARPEHA